MDLYAVSTTDPPTGDKDPRLDQGSGLGIATALASSSWFAQAVLAWFDWVLLRHQFTPNGNYRPLTNWRVLR